MGTAMENYIYYFEVAAAANLLIILYDMLTKKQYYRDDAIIFIKASVAQICLSLVDILSCFLLEYTAVVPLWINKLVIVVYFVLQALTIFYITMFPQAYNCHRIVKKSKNYVGAVILFIANAGMGIGSLWYPMYYYFDENKLYYQARFASMIYIFFFIMVGAIIVYALMPNHKYLMGERFSLVGAMLIIGLGNYLQFFIRTSLITGLCTSIALLLIYITMENPNSYMDKTSGSGNHEAIKRRMESWHPLKDRYAFVTVRIDNLEHFEHILEGDKSEEIISGLAEFLKVLTKSRRNVYRLDDNSITVIMPGGLEKVDEFLKGLDKHGSKGFSENYKRRYNLEYSAAGCVYPDQVTNFHKFHGVTDHLLGKIKGNISKHSIVANEEILNVLQRNDTVEMALKKALKTDGVDLYFQPIYDTKKRKITTLEALSRLTDPELGSVPPGEFIKIAETSGRIEELTKHQFEKICRFIQNHISNGELDIETININLSPILLNRKEMVPWLIEQMQKYNVPVGMINFEITESATADSPEILAIAIKQLMDAGAVFSLDDYGTGYSNILYMANFPFVSIKFDKELIWSYFEQDVFRTILDKEFELVQELKENIVAEGVENEEQLETLISRGIRYIQGYYFSSPLSERRIMEYLKSPAPSKWFKRTPEGSEQ